MYSERIINANLDKFASDNAWMPEYHSIDEVSEFKEYINSIISMTTNSRSSYISVTKPLTEKRQEDIRRWIENEQVLCGLDSSYFESRYAYVCNEGGQIFKFQNRNSQKVFDAVIADFDDKQVSIEILCLDPETKVLTADLQWVRIDDLKTGDDVVCVDEGETLEQVRDKRADKFKQQRKGTWKPKDRRDRISERKMRTGKIEAKWDTYDQAIRLTFDDGRQLIGSQNHIMMGKQRGGSQPEWKKIEDFRVGDEIRWITKPWEDPGYEDGWAGGIMDGEGSLRPKDRAGVEATITQVFNGVYWRMKEYLLARGYTVRESIDKRRVGCGNTFQQQDVGRLCLGRLNELFRLIGQTRPSRFIGKRFWEGKSLPGKNSGKGWSKIVSIEILPQQRLVHIQTTCRTFIAEGFVSHNCLKARQVGITTKTALKFIHRLLFVPHTQAVMASVQAEKSELIGRILNTIYERCPWWLIPQRRPKGSFENGSMLSIQSGMQATGIAQGWTPTLIHISELADIPKPKKVIEEGLLNATHSTRNLFMVFEGTGGGNTGWLADYWRSSKKNFLKGEARFCPVFIPWPMANDIYPPPDWIRKFPVPESFMSQRLDETRRHVTRCELYIRNTPYLAKIAGKDWRMPIEQQWFWQFGYVEAREKHTLHEYASQRPADDMEALTGKHDGIFPPETIKDIEDHIYEIRSETIVRKKAVQAYAITGHDVDKIFNPPENIIDYDREFIRVTWNSIRGQKYEWTLTPLLAFDEDEEKNSLDKLLVYEFPKAGCYYATGIDTADGLGKEDEERLCISTTRNRFNDEYDYQVCEFVSNRINPAQAVAFAAAIGAWYGVQCPDGRGMKYCVEQSKAPGDICQHQLKMMGFFNHHKPRRYDGKKVKEEAGSKEGWFSNVWSVPILMTRFVEAVNGGWYRPHSKGLIEELKTLERHTASGRSKMEHRAGQFDDRVRAAAQSFFTAHDFDILTERAQKRYAQPQKKQEISRAECTMSRVGVGDWD